MELFIIRKLRMKYIEKSRKQEKLPFTARRCGTIEELLAYFVKLNTLYKDTENNAYKAGKYSNVSFTFYMHGKSVFMPTEDEEFVVAGEKLGVDTVKVYFKTTVESIRMFIDDSMIKYIDVLPASIKFFIKGFELPITVWVS